MTFLISTTLGLALVATAFSAIRDSADRNRYQKIGEEIAIELRNLFHFIYPGYVENGRITFYVLCRRKWLGIGGRWKIKVVTAYDDSIQSPVERIVMERTTTLQREIYFRENADVEFIFRKS